MLSPPFLSLTRYFFLSLVLFPPPFFPFPLFCFCALLLFQLPPSLTLFTSHLLWAPFSIFSNPPFIPPHPFLPLSLSSPLSSSPRLSSPQLPRLSSRNRVWETERKGEQDREIVVSRLRQSCHQLRDLKVFVCGSVLYQFTLSSLIKGKSRLTCTHTSMQPPHPWAPSEMFPLPAFTTHIYRWNCKQMLSSAVASRVLRDTSCVSTGSLTCYL